MGGQGHDHDDEYHAAKHQAQHRFMEKVGFGTAEKAVERVTEAVGERLIERAGERVAERTGERLVERAGERALERAGEAAFERVGERAVERAGERALERVGERAVERAGERALERAGERAVERAGERALERAGERALERVGERAITRVGSRGTLRAGEGVAERVGERALERALERAAEKGGERAFERASERVVERAGEAALERLGERAIFQVRDRAFQGITEIGERLIERAGNSTLERMGEAALERAGERALERAAERAFEKAGERAVEGAGSRALEQVGERALERAGQRAVAESFRMNEAKAGKAVQRHTSAAVKRAAAAAESRASTTGGYLLMRSLKALQVAVPFVGMFFVAHLAHDDVHRMQQEWATRRKLSTTALFAVAAICDTIDVLVHLVVVASLTIFHVDHHLLHSIEHFGMCAAVCATVSMIVGEVMSSYTLTEEKKKASGEQAAEDKANPTADFASWALAGTVIAYLCSQSLGLKPVLTLTDRKSWAWEITAFCFFMKVAQDNKGKVAGFYWAKGLVATGIAAFGGGFLAPLLVARSPVPLMEETFAWMLVVAWYVTNNIPVVSDALTEIMNTTVASAMFKIFFNIFKTQQMVGSLELAAKAVAAEQLVPHSTYFAEPIAGPLICGFLGGCGGMFLPASTGLQPIEDGKVWNVRAAFFCPVIYFGATRFCGCDPLNAKMGICLLRMAGDLFPVPRDALLEAGTSLIYKGTKLRSTPLPIVVAVKKA